MKIFSTFAATSTLNGGQIRLLIVTGFFYACTVNIAARNPVWSVNAPTAVKVEVNRTCGLFLFSRYNKQILSVMTSTEKKCLSAKHSNRTSTPNGAKTVQPLSVILSGLIKDRLISKSNPQSTPDSETVVAFEPEPEQDTDIDDCFYKLMQLPSDTWYQMYLKEREQVKALREFRMQVISFLFEITTP